MNKAKLKEYRDTLNALGNNNVLVMILDALLEEEGETKHEG